MTRVSTLQLRLPCTVVLGLVASLSCGGERVVLPIAPQKAVIWRYTLQRPDEGWRQSDFDDSGWERGLAGFGTEKTPRTTVGTTWNTSDIWLRTEFQYDGKPFDKAAVNLYHDEDVTVFVNGRQILKRKWYVPRYELHEVTEPLKDAMREGRNVLAVTCHQTAGGQYVDVGIVLDPEQELLRDIALPPLKPLFDYPVRDTSICLGGDGNYYLTGTTGFPTWWKTNEGIRVLISWRGGT